MVLVLLAALPGCREVEAPYETRAADQGVHDVWHCVAPDRDEYKAEHGIYPDGPDGTFEDVAAEEQVEGMEHTVLFIFDRSGSMTTYWDHRDKWTVARDAMIDSVSKYQHYLSAGAIFFPTDMGCEVQPIQAAAQIDYSGGSDFLTRWETLSSEYAPVGQTPLNTAFELADSAITWACLRGILERPFKVVLLTDGEPNCDYNYEKLLAYPQKWLKQGIETHVIGLPGSEAAEDLLALISTAGGSELFILPDNDDPDQTDEDIDDFEDEVDIACE
jgi:hypothetical protein